MSSTHAEGAKNDLELIEPIHFDRSNVDPQALFFVNARAAADLEWTLASGELSLEHATNDTVTKLRPTVQLQLLHAFILCKLIFDGDLSQVSAVMRPFDWRR